MTSADAVEAAARRHNADLRQALQTFSAARSTTAEVADADKAADSRRARVDIRRRLVAAADFANLPPQILLPAQWSQDSPHRRPAPRR